MSIITELHGDNIMVVRYNKPKRKNAFDISMYNQIVSILKDVSINENICAVVLTGTGDFYSSGNDLNAAKENKGSYDLYTALKEFIDSLILFPKLLVAIVNGPAIGIAATTLPFCDLVFAAENSYFYTPFTRLGVVPEGCSTFTFARFLGERKATEMLMFNYKMSAEEALKLGFVNYIYKQANIQEKVWNKINEVVNISTPSLIACKKLMRDQVKEKLLKLNEIELNAINVLHPISKL